MNIKKTFIVMFLLVSTGTHAQDLIVKNNGDEIKVKVLSVDEDKVSYKKWSNRNGPTYSLGTDKIFMIKYENGDKDVFSNAANDKKTSAVSNPVNDAAVTGYVEKHPDANNAELIKKYNPHVRLNLKKGGTAHRHLPILAMEETSVLSNEDVELNLVRKVVKSKFDRYVDRYILRYYIEIKNKTDFVIYIDRGSSFKAVNDIATPFYDTKQISVSKGSGSGASLGLGAVAGILGVGGAVGQLANGVSVGGGTSSTVSTIYSQQRILAIPPHTSAYMSEQKYDNYKGNKWEKISEAEYYLFPFKHIRKGQCMEYDTSNTPFRCKYFITYSTYPDFKTYSFVNANLYVKYMVGISKFQTGATREETTVFCSRGQVDRCYKKIIPDFESEQSLIIGDI